MRDEFKVLASSLRLRTLGVIRQERERWELAFYTKHLYMLYARFLGFYSVCVGDHAHYCVLGMNACLRVLDSPCSIDVRETEFAVSASMMWHITKGGTMCCWGESPDITNPKTENHNH